MIANGHDINAANSIPVAVNLSTIAAMLSAIAVTLSLAKILF